MRFLRHTMFSLVLATLAALALGVPPVAAKLTLQDVGLSCSDGTALNLALSPTEVLDLLGAVLAINSFPAGDPPLACSLSGDPPGSGNPQHDSAVGGGTLQALGACHDSFALSAHVEADTLTMGIGGTFHLSQEPHAGCGSVGDLDAQVDCLQVSETTARADLTAVVTKSSGSFASLPPGTEIWVGAFDAGVGGTGDELGAAPTSGTCSFQSGALLPIQRGNISVHDG